MTTGNKRREAPVYAANFKIITVGESMAGKTSIINRFTENAEPEQTTASIGVQFSIKKVDYEGKKIKLTIYDTAGQERYASLTFSYYKLANAVVLVFDCTSELSFKRVEKWFRDIQNNANTDIFIVLVANKIDLKDKRVIQKE